MSDGLGITTEGVKVALDVKERYRNHQPIIVPGDETRILLPENLLNGEIDLHGFEDPLPLALVACRDPEAPMAISAVARMGPLTRDNSLVAGVFGMVGEATKHPLVRSAIKLITENSFDPRALVAVRRHARKVVIETRQQFTTALRNNLKALIDGTIAPRDFVHEFFELTEAGNLRHDIRKKLVLSLLMSPTIRPSIKFMLLENFQRLPKTVQLSIIRGVLQAEPSRHLEIIKEELQWMLEQERQAGMGVC